MEEKTKKTKKNKKEWKRVRKMKERECGGCYHNQLQWCEKPVITISEFAVYHYLSLRPDSMSVLSLKQILVLDEQKGGIKQTDGRCKNDSLKLPSLSSPSANFPKVKVSAK